MKNLKTSIILIFISILSFGQNIQNPLAGDISIYPIRYEDGMDIFIKTETEYDGELHVSYNEKDKQDYNDLLMSSNHLTLSKLKLNASYELEFYTITNNEKYTLNETPIVVNSNFDDFIDVAFGLNQKVNQYVSVKEQSVPFNEYLSSIIDNKLIYKEEAISYAQQFYFDFNNTLKRDGDVLAAIFKNYKKDGDQDGCTCKYIFNHNQNLAPNDDLDESNGAYSPTMTTNFFSSNPKPHMVLTEEKGPAHFKYLYMKGKNGGHKHQYTTLGVDNLNTNGAPNFAQISYNLNCQNYLLVPKDCACSKFVQIKYRYDAKMQLHTPDLPFFWSDGREAGVEEFTVLMANSAVGTHVLDAGRAKMHNKCNSDWNLDWFSNLGNLAVDALDLAVSVTSANGGVLDTIAGQAGGIINSIISLASTPVVNVTGGCNDGVTVGTLMEGTSLYVLKPNEPTTFVMTSHTYLGGRGYGSWLIQAHSHSNFAMSAIILGSAIAEEGFLKPADWCCTDKVGTYILGSQGGAPLSENNLRDYVGSHLGAWSPWDNVVYNPFTNLLTLPGRNVGYLIFNDPLDECAPTSGKNSEVEYTLDLNKEAVNLDQHIPAKAWENYEIMNKVKLDHLDPSIKFSIFPNPSVDEVNLSFYSPLEQEVEIYIYDVVGNKIAVPYIGPVPKGTLTIPYTLSEEFASGIYFVCIQTGDKILSIHKLIKN